MEGHKFNGFYSSTKWRKLRKQCLEKYNHLCQECLRYGLYTPADVVHHKIELTEANVNDASISLNMANLVPVCWECHRRIHGHTQHSRFIVDNETGELIDVLNDAGESLVDESKVNKN